MARPRTMTGITLTDEKPPQSPVSPASTDSTFVGDAIINIEGENATSEQPCSSVNEEAAQPGNDEKRPSLLHKITSSFKSRPDPPHVTTTVTRTLEETPRGFPQLAAFQSSEANFALYRSFGYLHSRILLDLQDELTSLEKELDEKDWDDFEDSPECLRSRDKDVDRASTSSDERTRRDILRDIRETMKEYDKFLIRARTLESFQRPSDRNYRSVRRYHTLLKPLGEKEMDAIRSKEDIISLHNGREWASFDGGVESMIGFTDKVLQKVFRTKSLPLQRFFRTPELQSKTTNPDISFYSSSRIDKLINVLITLVIFILLVIPVVTLYKLTNTSAITAHSSPNSPSSTSNSSSSSNDDYNHDLFNAVGVLMVFTLLFSAAMSLLTKAARHELFAASAAYCAILVVFIGNFTGPGS